MKNKIYSSAVSGLLAIILLLQLTACVPTEPQEDVQAVTASQNEAGSETQAPAETEPETDAEPVEETEAETEAATEDVSEPEEDEDAPVEAAPTEPTEALPVTGFQAPAAGEAQQSAATVAANPFALDPVGNYNLYAYDPVNWIYADLGYAYWSAESVNPAMDAVTNAINALPTLPTTEYPTVPTVEGGLLTIQQDGTYAKTEYFLYPGILAVDDVCYALTEEQYQNLKTVFAAAIPQGNAGAQWLVFMNPNRVTRIECTGENGEMLTMKAENIVTAATEPGYIGVISGKTYTPGSVSFDGMFRAKYTFDNGLIVYDIAVSDTHLYIEATGMGFGCVYEAYPPQLASYIETTQRMIDGDANPRTGKPVIYLYPQKTTDVNVRLDFQGKLTYTYPTYGSGWSVTASPDGSMVNKADGSTHYYLFWEGNADRLSWDFSKGFVVEGSKTEAFFKEKLPAMGLLPREYNDFITYWVPEMIGNPYNLITFSTAEYEETAPLTVTPSPDTVLRVHMVYMPLAEKIDVEEQTLPAAPARNGFTVVEWGGTRAK